MDLARLAAVFLVLGLSDSIVSANMVFKVQHKFAGSELSLSAFKAHDHRRHGRLLSSIRLPIGGVSNYINPSYAGLYYAKIGIGSPSKNYYVQVDTGSDDLWVNCAHCSNCPVKSDIGIKLTQYDPKGSSTGSLVTCDQDFCTSYYDGELPACEPNSLCQYKDVYEDNSSTAGYFVKDFVQFDSVSGNFQTATMNGSVIFGCGAKQSGELGTSSEALDGILGFGQANSSMISQLAASGKVKKMFAHCLDGVNGGGIFAIGQVVQPKLNSTPLVPNQAHYNVVMKAIEVGGNVLDLPTDEFDTGDRRGTTIDSGTALAYLPSEVYEPLMTKILAQQPGLKLHTVEDQFSCFQYTGNIDDGFSAVTFHFEDSVSLTIYPHEYLFQIREDAWCIGWQNGGLQSKDGKDITLLGDLVLSNKLVLYDLENQSLGWTEYNCSSSIKVKDETGAVYSVGAINISPASSLNVGRILTSLLILIALLHNFIN